MRLMSVSANAGKKLKENKKGLLFCLCVAEKADGILCICLDPHGGVCPQARVPCTPLLCLTRIPADRLPMEVLLSGLRFQKPQRQLPGLLTMNNGGGMSAPHTFQRRWFPSSSEQAKDTPCINTGRHWWMCPLWRLSQPRGEIPNTLFSRLPPPFN